MGGSRSARARARPPAHTEYPWAGRHGYFLLQLYYTYYLPAHFYQ